MKTQRRYHKMEDGTIPIGKKNPKQIFIHNFLNELSWGIEHKVSTIIDRSNQDTNMLYTVTYFVKERG